MSLAKRIVADRIARGPFRSANDLDRVPGVGPALIRVLEERLRFGVSGMSKSVPPNGAANSRISGADRGEVSASPAGPVDLNSASEADLMALPGIGRTRALAILAYRRDNGPFAAVSDLRRVPGFSQALVIRLTPFVMTR